MDKPKRPKGKDVNTLAASIVARATGQEPKPRREPKPKAAPETPPPPKP